MAEVTVTPATSVAALKKAASGDTFLFSPGVYLKPGFPDVPGASAAKPIVLRSADPASPARFTGTMTIGTGARGLRFEGIDFDISAATAADANIFRVYGAGVAQPMDLAWVGGRFIGRKNTNGDRWGVGIQIAGIVSGLLVSKCEAFDLKAGFLISALNGEICDNDIHDIGVDGIQYGSSDQLAIRRNRLDRFIKTAEGHWDAIQALKGNGEVLVEDNLIATTPQARVQGIFGDAHKRLTVRQNVLIDVSNQGISFFNVDDATIEDNVLLYRKAMVPAGGKAVADNGYSRVALSNSKGVARRNRAMQFSLPGVTQDGNMTVPAAGNTDVEVDAAVATWVAQFRVPGKPVVEPPPADPAVAQIAALTEENATLKAAVEDAERKVEALQEDLDAKGRDLAAAEAVIGRMGDLAATIKGLAGQSSALPEALSG